MSVMPTRPKGPPLNALRAFEAAARLGGFALAAAELNVTPGAVSQHIRGLEDWLGAPLFVRRSQGVRLTGFGADVLPDLSAAFDAVGVAVQGMRARAPQQSVHIAALPGIAQLWLLPRLPALRAALPGVEISVSAIETPPDLSRGVFDLSLFFREPDGRPGEYCLDEDRIEPVCAPAVAARIRSPGDLLHETRLHDSQWDGDWPFWAAAVLPGAQGIERGPRYSLYSLALAEAEGGAGVLMGHHALVRAALESGSLVAPLARPVATGLTLILESGRLAGLSASARTALRMLTGRPVGR